MSRSSTATAWLLGALILVAAGVLGAFGWRAWADRAAWRVARPDPPDLSGVAAELRARIEELDARVRQWPPETSSLGELARLYHANGFLPEAVQAYRGLLRFDPDNPRWPHLLANIVAGYGELDAALPLLRRTVALAPDYAPAQIRLGDVLLKTNRATEARAAYTAAREVDPKNPYALLGLARCELQTERWTAAREVLQQAVAAAPRFGAALHLLATVSERLGNRASAEAAEARARRTGRFRELPDPWVDSLWSDCYDVYRLRVAAAALSASGDKEEAIPLLERAIALDPRHAASEHQLGDLYRKLEKPEIARPHLERAVALDPEDQSARLDLASLLGSMGALDDLDRFLAESVERLPHSAGLHYQYGRRLATIGKLDEAARELKAAQRLQPEAFAAYQALAEIYERQGHEAEARAVMREGLAQSPGLAAAITAIERAIEAGDIEDAESLLAEWRQDIAPPPALVRKFRQRFGRDPRL